MPLPPLLLLALLGMLLILLLVACSLERGVRTQSQICMGPLQRIGPPNSLARCFLVPAHPTCVVPPARLPAPLPACRHACLPPCLQGAQTRIRRCQWGAFQSGTDLAAPALPLQASVFLVSLEGSTSPIGGQLAAAAGSFCQPRPDGWRLSDAPPCCFRTDAPHCFPTLRPCTACLQGRHCGLGRLLPGQ